jgi:polyisoprenoid-binding protein YceI
MLKKKVFFGMSILFLLAFSTSQWVVDTTDPAISFYFVKNKVAGTVGDFSGTVQWDAEQPERSILQGSVKVETLKTGNFIRNLHLRTSTYFDASAHPEMHFKSTKVQRKGKGYEVQGDLTIKGIKKSNRFDFDVIGNELVGKTRLNTQDFDISINKLRADNEVTVEIRFPIQK